ncbi:ankyrin repeat domain-containing protein 53 isoform X2 [Dendropsophus ebraccatus]|uniref:ankyrin repeat domain-containing protein 53 isoform X2 n=1 Tax=Dendropsophus ebraccatus TaxID=150705 RepID=UPI003831C3DA
MIKNILTLREQRTDAMSEGKTTETPRLPEPQETLRETMTVARDQLMAASIGNADWLQLCMRTSGCQQADRYGFTALHMAAVHSRLQCLKLLLEDYRMDVNVPSVYGWRALHLVINQKSGRRVMPCLRYLLQRGADVNVRSKNLSTPLHRAASEGLEDCIAVLVEAGADVHAEDSQGNKPIDLCHLWCRRSSARYLRSAMWKRDKEDYAQEVNKMEKVIQDIEELEVPQTKNVTDKLNMVRLELKKTSVPAQERTSSSQRRIPSRKVKKRITKESTKEDFSPNERGDDESGRRSATKAWNASTNPHRPPSLYISRIPALWQGINQDATKKGISCRVILTKDERGQLQIQTLQGQVFSPPNLPYDVIERSLFPKRGPQDRIKTPKDFKADHVFDVARKQQPLLKPASEISFHLRRDLDSKFRKSYRELAQKSLREVAPQPVS